MNICSLHGLEALASFNERTWHLVLRALLYVAVVFTRGLAM